MIAVDYLIVGGGIVGLTAAIAMQQRGHTVAVVDKHPLSVPNHSGRVYAINHASQALFSSLGIWPLVSECPAYEKMYVWDQSTRARLNFDCRERGTSALGFMIQEAELKAALYQQYEQTLPPLRAERLEEHSDYAIIQAYDEMNVEHHLKAKFVLITDGATSTLRAQLKVPVTHWPYHHRATVATIRTEKAHQKTAYQVFTEEGPLAFLPLSDPNLCSIVWSTSPEYAALLHALSKEDFETQLSTTFEHQLGKCELVSPRQQFDLQMRHTDQYHGKRWALMGDAAHTIHPLAGLGLNLGLSDLNAWLTLTNHATDPRSILGAYQRQRKTEVWTVIALMELIKTTFSSSFAPFQWARGLGMRFLNEVTPLKRLMMDYACGAIPHTKSGTTPP